MRTVLETGNEQDVGSTDGHDLAVTDGRTLDAVTPHVVLAERTPAGANIRAVLRPTSADSVIAAALRLAAAGYRTVPAESARDPAGERSLANDAGTSLVTSHAAAQPVALTQRERQVLALLAEGASNKLIARKLDISVHTAKFHVAAILEKLGAVNRTDAIAIAMREGLVLI
ncbi:helix-turn-helix transcriptional regulator [Mesorhizobium sp. BAC0120]|nr:helix-turn-helix transcriptional regulator [Mesorhizobium sp. BAC0120]